jgi:hypothetical protein
MKGFECKECGRTFDTQDSLGQHARAKHWQVKGKGLSLNRSHAYAAAIIIIVLAAVYLFYQSATSPGEQAEFAKCLSAKGFVLAGTNWCSHCKEQKALFGNSFQFIDFKNCDVSAEWCRSAGVRAYPTWITPDGAKLTGVKSLSALSQLSGCSMGE